MDKICTILIFVLHKEKTGTTLEQNWQESGSFSSCNTKYTLPDVHLMQSLQGYIFSILEPNFATNLKMLSIQLQ